MSERVSSAPGGLPSTQTLRQGTGAAHRQTGNRPCVRGPRLRSSPTVRDKRLRIGERARVTVGDIGADEEEGALREAIGTDLHLFPCTPCHQPRRWIETQRFRQDHPGIVQLRQISAVGRRPPSTVWSSACIAASTSGCCATRYQVQLSASAVVSCPASRGSGLHRGPAARSWDCRRPPGRGAASRAHRPSPRLWPAARQ